MDMSKMQTWQSAEVGFNSYTTAKRASVSAKSLGVKELGRFRTILLAMQFVQDFRAEEREQELAQTKLPLGDR